MPEEGKERLNNFENGSPLADDSTFFHSTTTEIQKNNSFSSYYTNPDSPNKKLLMCSEINLIQNNNASEIYSDIINNSNKSQFKEQVDRPVTAPPAHYQREQLRTLSEPPRGDHNTSYLCDNNIFKFTEQTLSRVNNTVVNNNESNFKSLLNPLIDCQTNYTSINTNDPCESISKLTSPTINNITSWHPHVYAMPPKAPTPHSIGDILGIKVPKKPTPIRPERKACKATINQILNASLKSPVSCDSSDYIMHYPRPHDEQILDRVPYNRTVRSSSLSEEGSEDDSIINDQPLNLSVTRSRDSSPVLKSYRQVKPKRGK